MSEKEKRQEEERGKEETVENLIRKTHLSHENQSALLPK